MLKSTVLWGEGTNLRADVLRLSYKNNDIILLYLMNISETAQFFYKNSVGACPERSRREK